MSKAASNQPSEIRGRAQDHILIASKAVLNSLPFVGGLATYLEAYYPGQVVRQIKDFAESLVDHSRSIGALRCDQKRLGTLISQVFHEIPRTTSEDKRSAFRAIILNCASGKSATEHEFDALLAVLSPLTDLELRILGMARYQGSAAVTERTLDSARTGGEPPLPLRHLIDGVNDDILLVAFDGLKRKRLLNPPQLAGDAHRSQLCLGHLILSKFGERFMEWIKRSA
jgi:hypothetical protein